MRIKGLRHPMKFSHQFDETKVVQNFDIATLRIYTENYIGRIRDWQIVSKTWPSSRTDLLGCCFQIFAFSINLLIVYRESVNLIGYITRRLSADSLQL